VESVFKSIREGLRASPSRRWCVAFSGGLDSSVLLHALSQLRHEYDDARLRAIHIHHGLHADADDWAMRCQDFARELDVPLETLQVDVDRASGEGIEAAARRARYAAFAETLSPGEVLLTAHHADDQVETFLLRLMRGSGVRGLSGIAVQTRFGSGELVRPLLAVSRAELERYGSVHGLNWVEDPSNADTALDRNYLRHEVLPVLMQRWPGLRSAVGRSARLLGEAGEWLDAAAAQDSEVIVRDGLLDVQALLELDEYRQRNLVRYVLHTRGLMPPSEARLRAGLEQLLTARADRQPILEWADGQIRRYRGRLYVLDASFAVEADRMPLAVEYAWDGKSPLDLGPLRGRLSFDRPLDGGSTGADLCVRFRQGGERGLMADGSHHAKLKKVFQSRGVVPWMRAHVPLLFDGDELLSAGDLWLSDWLLTRLDSAQRLVWDGHPEVF